MFDPDPMLPAHIAHRRSYSEQSMRRASCDELVAMLLLFRDRKQMRKRESISRRRCKEIITSFTESIQPNSIGTTHRDISAPLRLSLHSCPKHARNERLKLVLHRSLTDHEELLGWAEVLVLIAFMSNDYRRGSARSFSVRLLNSGGATHFDPSNSCLG